MSPGARLTLYAGVFAGAVYLVVQLAKVLIQVIQ